MMPRKHFLLPEAWQEKGMDKTELQGPKIATCIVYADKLCECDLSTSRDVVSGVPSQNQFPCGRRSFGGRYLLCNSIKITLQHETPGLLRGRAYKRGEEGNTTRRTGPHPPPVGRKRREKGCNKKGTLSGFCVYVLAT